MTVFCGARRVKLANYLLLRRCVAFDVLGGRPNTKRIFLADTK